MAKVNLSIPDELKSRMDAHSSLNWSRIAAAAFETALGIEEMKGTDMNESGLARLRASREQATTRNHASGFALGKSWALERADFEDLERVAGEAESIGDQQDPAYALARAVLDEDNPSFNDIESELIGFFGRGKPAREEVIGFVEGAAEVFEAV